MMIEKKIFDVIIVGGSYAGMSAAMALGRSLREVLIIDSGKPCNKPSPHSHNFLTQDGKTPKEITNNAKKQVLVYPTVQLINGLAIKGKRESDLFVIETDSNEVFRAKKLLFATGIKDILPDISGLSKCWGISVLHCPYCHGYEVKNTKIGLLGNGDLGFEMASLIHNWTKNLILFTNGQSMLTTEQSSKIMKYDIKIIEKRISHIEHRQGYVEQIIFEDNSSETVKALFARGNFEQHCQIPLHLGCELTEQGYIKVDAVQRTSQKGIYAAGDNTTMFRSVAVAVASGNKAGALMNKELIDEVF